MIVKSLWRVRQGLPNLRLFIEYVMIGALVALIGHAVLSWSERSQLAQRAVQLQDQLTRIKGTLDQQIAINRDQDVAIARLRSLREIDRQAMAGLHTDLSRITSRDLLLRQHVIHLEDAHDEVKRFLDIAVPDVLRCLLNGDSCQDSHDDADPR